MCPRGSEGLFVGHTSHTLRFAGIVAVPASNCTPEVPTNKLATVAVPLNPISTPSISPDASKVFTSSFPETPLVPDAFVTFIVGVFMVSPVSIVIVPSIVESLSLRTTLDSSITLLLIFKEYSCLASTTPVVVTTLSKVKEAVHPLAVAFAFTTPTGVLFVVIAVAIAAKSATAVFPIV